LSGFVPQAAHVSGWFRKWKVQQALASRRLRQSTCEELLRQHDQWLQGLHGLYHSEGAEAEAEAEAEVKAKERRPRHQDLSAKKMIEGFGVVVGA
jgi:hypothetical protein